MLAAGFLFMLFCTLSGAVGYTTWLVVNRFAYAARRTSDRLVCSVSLFCALVSLVRLLIQPLVGIHLNTSIEMQVSSQFAYINSLLFCGALFASAGFSRAWRYTVRFFAICSILSFIVQLSFIHYVRDDLMVTACLTMFCLIALGVAFTRHVNFWDPVRNGSYVVALFALPLVLIFVSFFAELAYPHISAKWGGGKPVRVTVTLSKDATQPGAILEAVLVEDTDLGIYVAEAEGKPARFIPRANISQVEYKPERYYGFSSNYHLDIYEESR